MMTVTEGAKMKGTATATITAALVQRPLEVGQSPNAFFVNVTKCEASAAAASLYPLFSHAQTHKSPPHLLLGSIEIQFPQTSSGGSGVKTK